MKTNNTKMGKNRPGLEAFVGTSDDTGTTGGGFPSRVTRLCCMWDDAQVSASTGTLFRLHALVWGQCRVWKRGGSMEGAGDGGEYDADEF